MFRGIKIFKCTKCGNTFSAPDIEWMATSFSVPQKCPKCGSIRTRPGGNSAWLDRIFGSSDDDGVYKKIWDDMEKTQ